MKDFSDWLDPMLSSIRFSAFGFFHINYNMLFGFISALITYLVILIQFNSLSNTNFDETQTQKVGEVVSLSVG